MFCQVHRTHPAGPNVSQQFVFAKKETFEPAFDDFVCLPGCRQFRGVQKIGKRLGRFFRVRPVVFLDGSLQRICIHHIAFFDQLQKFCRGYFCHRIADGELRDHGR